MSAIGTPNLLNIWNKKSQLQDDQTQLQDYLELLDATLHSKKRIAS